MTKQSQKGGDNSNNLQCRDLTIINNEGTTPAEVREIAKAVFVENFYTLAGNAPTTAMHRSEEITENFLQKLQQENPEGLAMAQDPDFQYGLFTVQKEYARHGDKDLGELLIDILVERSKHDKRNLLQIVLNEALEVAPKLTQEQMAALSIAAFIRYIIPKFKDADIVDFDLGAQLDNYIRPFVDHLSKDPMNYNHLVYSGCVTNYSISESFLIQGPLHKNCCGLFFNGLRIKEMGDVEGIQTKYPSLFMPCPWGEYGDEEQVAAMNWDHLQKLMDDLDISILEKKIVGELFSNSRMDINEYRGKCEIIRPYMAKVFEFLDGSYMGYMRVTSVGIAIAHANIKRHVGEFADLSNWINKAS